MSSATDVNSKQPDVTYTYVRSHDESLALTTVPWTCSLTH